MAWATRATDVSRACTRAVTVHRGRAVVWSPVASRLERRSKVLWWGTSDKGQMRRARYWWTGLTEVTRWRERGSDDGDERRRRLQVSNDDRGRILQLHGVAGNEGGQSIDDKSCRKAKLTEEEVAAAVVPHPNPARWSDLWRPDSDGRSPRWGKGFRMLNLNGGGVEERLTTRWLRQPF
jgi:hypothetical protein